MFIDDKSLVATDVVKLIQSHLIQLRWVDLTTIGMSSGLIIIRNLRIFHVACNHGPNGRSY